MSSPSSVKHRLVEPALATWRNTQLFHARDTRSLRGVVLRTVDADITEARSTLLGVIHRAVDLSHPVIDLALPDVDDGRICLTSDIWPGETLENRLRAGPLAVGQALDVARNLAAGLATLHAKGLVHAGVHPANVWLAKDGGVRLLGLGLESLDDQETLDLHASEAAYLAPEVVRGQPLTPAADVWALGAIFRECLSGRRTFGGDDTTKVLRAILHRKVRPLGAASPTAFSDFLCHAMERDPTRRFADCDAAHRALLAVPERQQIDPTRPLSLQDQDPLPAIADLDSPVSIGQVIQGYEVIGRLGSGGMGIVYRARDQRLNRIAALKFLPVDFRDDARRQDFEREARAASALDHPNICTIFGIDESPDGDTFIAMACYDGPSLADRLLTGPVPMDEALQIAGQLASGLAAAHDHGIVHRDIKPGNILFGRDGLAKIVDFGLSRITEPDADSNTPEELYGTIGYVAPEVVRNEPFDERADIWALGVVLYEMISGRRIFAGDELSTLLETLEKDPPPLSEIVPGVPKELDAILGKALARDPQDRYQSATQMEQDLRHLGGGLSEERVDLAAARRRLSAALGSAAVIVLAGLGAWAFWHRPAPEPARTAVVGFRATGLEPWIALALGDLVTLELEARGGYAVRRLPARQAADALGRLNGDSGWPESTLRGLPEIDTLAGGWVEDSRPAGGNEAGGELHATLALQDAGGVPKLFTAGGPESALPELAHRLVDGATGSKAEVRPSLEPPRGEAGVQLETATGLLRVLDSVQALEAADHGLRMTRHPHLLLARAEALWDLGRESEAAGALGEAVEQGAPLPVTWAIYLRARGLDFERQYPRAAALHHSLWRLQVDRAELPPDAAYNAAIALTRAGEPEQALELLDRLPADDPRLELIRADAFHWLGRFDDQLQAIERATARATAENLPFVLARSLRQRALAQWRVGELEAGLEGTREAAQLYERLGHVKGQADAATAGGILLYESGDMVRAKDSYDRSAQLYASLGNHRAEARTLTNKALVLQQQGDLGAQIEVTERVLVLFRQSGDKLAELITQVNLAEPLMQRAHFSDAEAAYLRALALVEEVDRFEAWASLHYGSFLTTAGRLPTARVHLERAREVMAVTGDDLGAAEAAAAIARLLGLLGDLPEAAELYRQALPVLEQRGSPAEHSAALRAAAELSLALDDRVAAGAYLARTEGLKTPRIESDLIRLTAARAAMEGGDLARAESLIQEALHDLELRQVTLLRGEALGLLAGLALMQGEPAKALAYIRDARGIFDLPAPSGERSRQMPSPLRLSLRITELRAVATDGGPEALEGLQTLLAEVISTGLVPLELEARLALGEAELEAGYQDAGRARLRDLAAEARLKGFLSLARRADLADG